MRRTVQTLLYTAALAAAAAGAYTLAERAADELEMRTGAAVRGALSRSEIDWAWVEIDGMQAILRGPAPDEAARFRALAAAGEVLNPLNLRDEMSISLPVRRPDTAFRVELLRNGDSILIHGLAPASGAPMLTGLTTGNAELEIVDLVAHSSDPAPETWDIAADLAVQAMSELRTARVVLTPGALKLDGIAPNRETALDLETRLDGAQFDGLATDIALKLPRPVLSPFMTRFTLDETSARFEICAAESEAGRATILAAAVAAGAGPDADCTAALGAPDPNWSATVAQGISLVSALGAGTVTFSDLSVTISLPAVARDSSEFETRMARFETALPQIYALSVVERPDTSAEDYELRFTATRSPEGLINLRGPVGPLDAREIVQTLADARFGGGRLHTALRGGTALPDAWPVQVMAAVDALTHLDTGMVTLTPGLVSVRGTTGDPDAEAAIAHTLGQAVGATLAYEIDVSYAEELDPVVVARGPTPQQCVSRINTLLEENDVSFPPGAVEIDAAGLDTVGQIADILFQCPEVEMEIGGHTDSQGREEMNQLLSQARADAVLNALIERRVLTSNLTSKGYGEAEPIADNDTAEGREANRRIRFSLVGADGRIIEAEAWADEAADGATGEAADAAADKAADDAAEGPADPAADTETDGAETAAETTTATGEDTETDG